MTLAPPSDAPPGPAGRDAADSGRARAAELPAGWRRVALDGVGSTNDEAKKLAAAGTGHGTVVTARRQEGGRGRRGSGWQSPEGNFYGSVILRSGGTPQTAGQLAFVVALALADAVLRTSGLEPGLKWPNDLVLPAAGGAKISGILLESETGADGRIAWVVAGTGVNLTRHPRGLDRPVTDLAAAGGRSVDPETFLAAYATALDGWERRWRRDGFGPVRDGWLRRAVGLGGPATARLISGTLNGVAEGLAEDGALVLRLTDGTSRRIAAGEVFFGPPPSRPAGMPG